MADPTQQPQAELTGKVFWEKKARSGTVGDPVPDDKYIGRAPAFVLNDELQGVTFRCPRCFKMRAVLRRARREAPLIGTDYWLLCLKRFGIRHSTPYVRWNEPYDILAPLVGAPTAESLMQDE